MTEIPETHPRYASLVTRERMVAALREGLTTEAGLMAHGRGEAFDYLLGERTREFTRDAYRASAALLLNSRQPVISVNGNSTPLALEDTVRLAELVPCLVEVNLFHRSGERVRRLADKFRGAGLAGVLGENPDERIPGLDHARGLCSHEGIYSADTVLVLLEDGDRTQALRKMGKRVISVDLNPLSRTAQTSDVCIVDNVTRAMAELVAHVEELKGAGMGEEGLRGIVASFDREASLRSALDGIIQGLSAPRE